MNANLMSARPAETEHTPAESVLPHAPTGFAQINESLQRRERLLAASARASRLLLQAPDVMAAVPAVLREIGEAANVDRVNLMLSQPGPSGESLLVVAAEWVADGVVPHLGHPTMGKHNERDFQRECEQLRSGRSVCITNEDSTDRCGCVLEGVGTKSKAIVPIFVGGEYVGVVGFDSTRQRRAIDSPELSALETAAGVIGAALHRERLVDAVRRERERAAEERVAELAKTNAAIRSNLERLANEPELHNFMGHILLEATRQLKAAGGAVIVLKESVQEWHIVAYVKDGEIAVPEVAKSVPCSESKFDARLREARAPVMLDLNREEDAELVWPGTLDIKRQRGLVRMSVTPLVFGGRTLGCISLSFRHHEEVSALGNEMLVALAAQATLAIELTRRAHSAKEAAVLSERNRIGQEIHDGLAQAFTGILMQLSAAEDIKGGFKCAAPLAGILARIRELAKEGLAEARRSVLALRPEQTRRGGLATALTQLAERATVTDRVQCTFEGGHITTGLPPEHEHALLRIAQEAVSNALRHARPSQVRIVLSEEPAQLELAVIDNGTGMSELPELLAQGFGLTNMRERASAIGGKFLLESRPGAGTTIRVRLPRRATS